MVNPPLDPQAADALPVMEQLLELSKLCGREHVQVGGGELAVQGAKQVGGRVGEARKRRGFHLCVSDESLAETHEHADAYNSGAAIGCL